LIPQADSAKFNKTSAYLNRGEASDKVEVSLYLFENKTPDTLSTIDDPLLLSVANQIPSFQITGLIAINLLPLY
jgi:hypothetical protein